MKGHQANSIQHKLKNAWPVVLYSPTAMLIVVHALERLRCQNDNRHSAVR